MAAAPNKILGNKLQSVRALAIQTVSWDRIILHKQCGMGGAGSLEHLKNRGTIEFIASILAFHQLSLRILLSYQYRFTSRWT
jgi:hypothetical protein